MHNKHLKKIILLIICTAFSYLFGPKTKYEKTACIAYAHEHLKAQNSTIDELFFVPGDEVKMILLGLIHEEKRSIKAALFRITDKHIVEALIEAHKRGVKIELILDHGALTSMAQKVDLLIAAKIPLIEYNHGLFSIMHHKLFIFERTLGQRPIVWYGSANATQGGMSRNWEVVHVWNQPKALNGFSKEFKRMKDCEHMRPVCKKPAKPMKHDLFYTIFEKMKALL